MKSFQTWYLNICIANLNGHDGKGYPKCTDNYCSNHPDKCKWNGIVVGKCVGRQCLCNRGYKKNGELGRDIRLVDVDCWPVCFDLSGNSKCSGQNERCDVDYNNKHQCICNKGYKRSTSNKCAKDNCKIFPSKCDKGSS